MTRTLRRLVPPLAFIGAAWSTVAAAQPRPITLQEAVQLARQNAPDVVQARGQERATDAAVRSSYGAFIPDLRLSAGATRQSPAGRSTVDESGQIISAGERWSYSTGLSASVDLFRGGRRFFDLRQARARDAAAEAGLVNQEFVAALNAKEQFFAVIAARESQIAAAAQLDQARQQHRTSVALARARQATRSDSLRAEIQLRTAELVVVEADNEVGVAEAALTRAVGSDQPVTAAPAPADTASETLALADADLAAMAERGPLVTQSQSLLRAARAANTMTWTDYLPSASLSYSRGMNAGEPDFRVPDDWNYSGSLRLSLSMPIFDQFQREERHVLSDVAEENAEASLRDAQLGAREGIVRWLGAWRVARERVAAQAATVEAAEEDLRVQQQRYAVGGSTLLDVLTSQTQLNQARRDLIQARFDRRVAKAQLEALVGREL